MARIRAPSVGSVSVHPEAAPGQRVTRARAAKATAPSKVTKGKAVRDREKKRLDAQQAKKAADLKEKLSPRSGSTIWVGNLVPVAQIEIELRELFSRYCGDIDELYIAGAVGQVGQTVSAHSLAEDTHVYAFIRFKQVGTGRKALRLDRTQVCGRDITVKQSFSELPEARAIAERWCAKKVSQNALKESDVGRAAFNVPVIDHKQVDVAPTLIIDRSKRSRTKKVAGANTKANVSLEPIAEEVIKEEAAVQPNKFKLFGYSFAAGLL